MTGGTLGLILDEADEIFRFDSGSRPQDRAHEYIKRHQVMRGYDDTAMGVAVADLIRRAYTAGLGEGERRSEPLDPDVLADAVVDRVDVLADAVVDRFKTRAFTALMEVDR